VPAQFEGLAKKPGLIKAMIEAWSRAPRPPRSSAQPGAVFRSRARESLHDRPDIDDVLCL